MPDDFCAENLTSSTPEVIGQSDSVAPVHINVGGITYTSCLKTLTKYPNSKLAKLFNGSLPTSVDPHDHRYFLDRDGKMFRHILNFLRNSELLIPDNFSEMDLLIKEAQFYKLEDLCKAVKFDEPEQQTEDESSTENTDQQGRKVKKKRRRKKVIQGAAVQVTGNEEEHSSEVEGVQDVGSTDKDDLRNAVEVKPPEELSTVGVEFVCVVTSKDKVEELWSSDEDLKINIDFIEGNLKLIKKKRDYKNYCLGWDKYQYKIYSTSLLCSVCAKHLDIDNVLTISYYRTNGGLMVCCACYNNALTKNRLAEMYHINLVGAVKWTITYNIGLPLVAKHLLIHGYKLVTCSVHEGYFYNYFVKQ